MSSRTMSVAGSFYPADSQSVLEMIEHFNTILTSHPDVWERFNTLKGRAIIVPHAGWIYSGFTANIAHRTLLRGNPKTVVVIGPSHRVGFDGVSIADANLYQTPLGDLKIDRILVNNLMQKFGITYFPQAHHEHSTEVQMPFIKHYCPEVEVVELVYAYAESSLIETIISYVLEQSGTAVVISTDLSHYYSLSQANQLDSVCLDAIRNENVKALYDGCEACGMIGVEAMLNVAHKRGMEATVLDYRTSADASGDTSRVVGYASALFR